MITLILLKYSANVASAFPWVIIYMSVCVCMLMHLNYYCHLLLFSQLSFHARSLSSGLSITEA